MAEISTERGPSTPFQSMQPGDEIRLISTPSGSDNPLHALWAESVFLEWVTVFPGKMGICWKHAGFEGNEMDARAAAAKNCNVVAVPKQLWERLDHYQRLSVELAAQKRLAVDST